MDIEKTIEIMNDGIEKIFNNYFICDGSEKRLNNLISKQSRLLISFKEDESRKNFFNGQKILLKFLNELKENVKKNGLDFKLIEINFASFSPNFIKKSIQDDNFNVYYFYNFNGISNFSEKELKDIYELIQMITTNTNNFKNKLFVFYLGNNIEKKSLKNSAFELISEQLINLNINYESLNRQQYEPRLESIINKVIKIEKTNNIPRSLNKIRNIKRDFFPEEDFICDLIEDKNTSFELRLMLGHFYFYGFIVDQDYDNACEIYESIEHELDILNKELDNYISSVDEKENKDKKSIDKFIDESKNRHYNIYLEAVKMLYYLYCFELIEEEVVSEDSKTDFKTVAELNHSEKLQRYISILNESNNSILYENIIQIDEYLKEAGDFRKFFDEEIFDVYLQNGINIDTILSENEDYNIDYNIYDLIYYYYYHYNNQFKDIIHSQFYKIHAGIFQNKYAQYERGVLSLLNFDIENAVNWFILSAKNFNYNALSILAFLYIKGAKNNSKIFFDNYLHKYDLYIENDKGEYNIHQENSVAMKEFYNTNEAERIKKLRRILIEIKDCVKSDKTEDEKTIEEHINNIDWFLFIIYAGIYNKDPELLDFEEARKIIKSINDEEIRYAMDALLIQEIDNCKKSNEKELAKEYADLLNDVFFNDDFEAIFNLINYYEKDEKIANSLYEKLIALAYKNKDYSTIKYLIEPCINMNIERIKSDFIKNKINKKEKEVLIGFLENNIEYYFKNKQYGSDFFDQANLLLSIYKNGILNEKGESELKDTKKLKDLLEKMIADSLFYYENGHLKFEYMVMLADIYSGDFDKKFQEIDVKKGIELYEEAIKFYKSSSRDFETYFDDNLFAKCQHMISEKK